ncbi:MAG: hypothetical protein QM604_10960, partial [Microbacterium sp.]
AFAAIVGLLVLVGLAGGAVGALQGPRVTDVQFDVDAAVSASGSRLILTTSQSLEAIDPSQVAISPAVDVTVSTSGRQIGIRFALPLYDETTYTVTITGVTGTGGGPASTITETITTPSLDVYMLQRADDGDTVYRTGLDGVAAVPVYTASHIEDFRVTASYLVISIRTDDDRPALIVTDLDGQGARELPLPGDGTGTVQELGSADTGDVIGYTYTDADPAASGALTSALFTASLKPADADAAPTAIQAAGATVEAADWRFVPDTDSILVLSFAGRLLLTPSDGSNVVDLGDAARIEGIARGSATAVVLRTDGYYTVDLSDGTMAPLVDAAGVTGSIGIILPLPDGTTLREISAADGMSGADVYLVAADGTPTHVFETASTDALLQTCVSPSGRYAAFLVQPDAASNPYVTGYDLPVPATVATHIVDLDDGSEVSSLGAFAISWCQVPLQ